MTISRTADGWLCGGESSGHARSGFAINLQTTVLSAETVARVADIAASNGAKLDGIATQSASLAAGRAVVSLTGTFAGDLQVLRRELIKQLDDRALDINCLDYSALNRDIRLAVFDMDSTLIKAEVIDELAVRAGVGEQVATITKAAMRGELDFKQSFAKRLGLLAGLDAGVIPQVAAQLQLMDGATRLMNGLKARGCRIVIASGGFTHFAEHISGPLKVDEYHANVLDIANGKLTGKVVVDIVDGARKAVLLQSIAAEHGIPLAQTLAVGDGANDLQMIGHAGIGVAFRAKPIVQQQAPYAINQLGLDGVLYLLGLNDVEIDATR